MRSRGLAPGRLHPRDWGASANFPKVAIEPDGQERAEGLLAGQISAEAVDQAINNFEGARRRSGPPPTLEAMVLLSTPGVSGWKQVGWSWQTL